MKYAVIRTGGKQYRVSEGNIVTIDKILAPKDEKHTFDEVLLYKDGEKAVVGKPMVTGVAVLATILDQKKGEKIRVAKFKAKARFRRVMGFRPLHTVVRIDAISEKGKSSVAKEEKPVKKSSAQTKTK